MDKYEVLEVLGQGSMAVVRRGRRRCDGAIVALKKVRCHDDEEFIKVRQEFDLLSDLRHAHIIRSLEFINVARSHCVVVMEFSRGRELQLATQEQPGGCFEERRARRLFGQLLQALSYLHGHGVLHRDVKGPNVLVEAEPDALKLVDFNTACRLAEGGCLTMTGTQEYHAPEVLAGQCLTEQSDVWAAGLCLHLMLRGSLPHRVEHHISVENFAKAISTKPVKLGRRRLERLSTHCVQALRRALALDARRRPSAAELLASAWLLQGEEVSRDSGLQPKNTDLASDGLSSLLRRVQEQIDLI